MGTKRPSALERLSRRLESLSSGAVVLTALAIVLAFGIMILPAQWERSTRELHGVTTPDRSGIYSAEDINGWAEAYGPDGRAAYIHARWTFDLVFPLVYGFFLVTATSLFGKWAYAEGSRWRLMNVVPLVGMFFDYTENALASWVMFRYPTEAPVAATLASPASVAKWVLVGGSVAWFGWTFARGLWRIVEAKYRPAPRRAE